MTNSIATSELYPTEHQLVTTSKISTLSEETIIQILTYLRATDFVSVTEVDKTIFAKNRVTAAIQQIMEQMSSNLTLYGSSPFKKQLSISNCIYRPDSYFVFEVNSILSAMSAPQPILGKGYWISTSWISNAKKYYEALNLPDLDPISRKLPIKKKQAKIRQRRGSESLPPWPFINIDLCCPHGGLALAKVPKAKRRAIDSRSWFLLRRYFPSGPQFKLSTSCECYVCAMEEEEAKASTVQRREAEKMMRRLDVVPEALVALQGRKSGVPAQAVTSRWASFLLDSLEDGDMSPVEANDLIQLSQDLPLLPGLYNLIPREWLRLWRRYSRDPSILFLPPIDCSRLLCHVHGLLLIPPHLEGYLTGLRRSLVNGLGTYPGEVVEIVTIDEWEELSKVMNGLTDFSVRLSIDADGSITWNHSVCHVCDPYNASSSQCVPIRPPRSPHEVLVR